MQLVWFWLKDKIILLEIGVLDDETKKIVLRFYHLVYRIISLESLWMEF